MMNNELTLNTREQKLDVVTNQLAAAVRMPLKSLTSYYGRVLERELSITQTLTLLNAQLAFFLTVFPADCSMLLRVGFACWLVKALLKCRAML
jgi:hypothetical protein